MLGTYRCIGPKAQEMPSLEVQPGEFKIGKTPEDPEK